MLGGLDQVLSRDRAVLEMGGDHIGEAEHGGHALGLVRVVALDGLGDARVKAPAPGENAAD